MCFYMSRGLPVDIMFETVLERDMDLFFLMKFSQDESVFKNLFFGESWSKMDR